MGLNQSQKGFNEDNLQLKTNSNGRWPQNMRIWISQQALIGSSSNFKHKLMGPHQSQITKVTKVLMKTTLNERRPLMEDDLKI